MTDQAFEARNLEMARRFRDERDALRAALEELLVWVEEQAEREANYRGGGKAHQRDRAAGARAAYETVAGRIRSLSEQDKGEG